MTAPYLDLNLSFVSTDPCQVAETVEWSSVAELSSALISHESCLVQVAEIAIQ